ERDQVLGLPKDMSAVDYYRLPSAERLRYGRPVIDHAAYTAENGLVALAYLKLYQATSAPLWLARAHGLLHKPLERSPSAGSLRQAALTATVKNDPRMRAVSDDAESKLYLRPQVQVGYALLALHEATGETRYLDAARKLAAAIEPLWVAADGGFL